MKHPTTSGDRWQWTHISVSEILASTIKWAAEPHSTCYLTLTRVHSIINLKNDRNLYIPWVKALLPHCSLSIIHYALWPFFWNLLQLKYQLVLLISQFHHFHHCWNILNSENCEVQLPGELKQWASAPFAAPFLSPHSIISNRMLFWVHTTQIKLCWTSWLSLTKCEMWNRHGF